jgi:hypothetical protein
LPSDPQATRPGQLYEWVRTHTPEDADAVFIGGDGFRAIGIIGALEEHLARPVLIANHSRTAFESKADIEGPACEHFRHRKNHAACAIWPARTLATNLAIA